MTPNPVEPEDLDPLQRSLDRIEAHLRGIRSLLTAIVFLLVLPVIAGLIAALTLS